MRKSQTNGVFTPEQDNDKTTRRRQDDDKTNVEPVHSYDAFHTRSGNEKTNLVWKAS